MKVDDRRYQFDRMRYALQRRRRAAEVDRLYREIVSSWDQPAFRERFRGYWNPFPSTKPAKFLDLETWFREAVFRALWCGVEALPAKSRLLDLGAGTGYFLVVARHLGHDVLGLDVDDEPLYRECFDYFGLPRVTQAIEPFQPLPESLGGFDLITAFMTCFDERPDGSQWGVDEWLFLLRDLRNRLNAGGRIVIRFNLNQQTREFYSDEVRRAVRSLDCFRSRFFFDSLTLTAR